MLACHERLWQQCTHLAAPKKFMNNASRENSPGPIFGPNFYLQRNLPLAPQSWWQRQTLKLHSIRGNCWCHQVSCGSGVISSFFPRRFHTGMASSFCFFQVCLVFLGLAPFWGSCLDLSPFTTPPSKAPYCSTVFFDRDFVGFAVLTLFSGDF